MKFSFCRGQNKYKLHPVWHKHHLTSQIPTFYSTNLFNVIYPKDIALVAQGRVKLSNIVLERIEKKT